MKKTARFPKAEQNAFNYGQRKSLRTILHGIVLCLFLVSALLPTGSTFAQASFDDVVPTPEAPTDPQEFEQMMAQMLAQMSSNEQQSIRQTLNLSYSLYLPHLTTSGSGSSGQPPSGYFVATNGSDSAAGTFDKPWRSINTAVSRLKPGDTLYVRGGIYNESVNIRVSGTQSAPVKVIGYQGETAVLEGSFVLPKNYSGLLSIYGDWVQVYNLEVRNSLYIGVGMYGKHGLVDGVFAHHSNKSGIAASGDYSIVQNSKAWRNSLLNENSKSPNSYSTGITASRDPENGLTEYAIIRGNHAWENWGQGISTYEASGTIISGNVVHDSYSTNIYISDATGVTCKGNFVFMDPGSYIYGHGANVGIMLGDERYLPPSSNITIINNIAFGNKRNLFWWKGEKGFMHNVTIANNTFVNSTYGAGVMLNEGAHVNVRFQNNIVQQDDSLPPIALNANQDIRFANNVWSKTPQRYAAGTGDFVGDPGLMRGTSIYSTDWYRLTPTSPAINKALPMVEVDTDFFYTLRGSAPDAGAVEYVP